MDYNTVKDIILTGLVIANIAYVMLALILLGYNALQFVGLTKECHKRKKYAELWNCRFIKSKPILTPNIKALIKFIRKFGIKIKVLGVNYFELELGVRAASYYNPDSNTIVLNPNDIQSRYAENAILTILAHEFGHALAVLIGRNYPRSHITDRAISAHYPEGTIRDEQQAWSYAHKCLHRLFPTNRDLIKTMYAIYDDCMATYLHNLEIMELLNEKRKNKNKNAPTHK